MRLVPTLLVCLCVAAAGPAQAVQEPSRTLACKSERVGPFLDFEYRFVLGAWFHLPVKQFWGDSVGLNFDILYEPVNGTPGESVQIDDRLQMTEPVPQGHKGEIYFSSAVSVGPGQYRSSWRISDDRGRSCEGSGNFKVALKRRDRAVDVILAPGEIVDSSVYMFRPEPFVERPHLGGPRRMKVFISMDVIGRRGRLVKTRLLHVMPLFAALRQLLRSPSFNAFSIVVFSFEDQKVLLRQDYSETVEFAALTGVLGQLDPATVDVGALMRGSEMSFFESMVAEELLHSEAPDAVVFIGRDLNFGKRISNQTLDRIRALGASFAFLDASRYAWRGAMGSLVRAMDGKEFALRRPADLAKAIETFESRVDRQRAQ